MLGRQINDETDGRSRSSPLMSLFRKIKPKRRHRSGSPNSPKSQRQRKVKERVRNEREQDGETSSVSSDSTVESEVACMEEMSLTQMASGRPSSCDATIKAPGNGEIVSLVSEKSTQGDGMLRVTSERWEGLGEEELFKVDCMGQYNDPATKFLWCKPKPTIKEHENCLGAFLNAVDPSKKSSTGTPEEQYPLRLCCHRMKDGKIHLAAHKVPKETTDKEELLYVCKLTDRSGIITIQENVSCSGEPLAGSYIGSTNDGQIQMFQPSQYEPYTANPFAYFCIMDLAEVNTEPSKRMNGEK